MLLRDRRDGGGSGLRCHGWLSVRPPRRTHSRAAVIGGSPLDNGRRHSKRAGAASPAANLGHPSVRRSSPPGRWELAATLQACRRGRDESSPQFVRHPNGPPGGGTPGGPNAETRGRWGPVPLGTVTNPGFVMGHARSLGKTGAKAPRVGGPVARGDRVRPGSLLPFTKVDRPEDPGEPSGRSWLPGALIALPAQVRQRGLANRGTLEVGASRWH